MEGIFRRAPSAPGSRFFIPDVEEKGSRAHGGIQINHLQRDAPGLKQVEEGGTAEANRIREMIFCLLSRRSSLWPCMGVTLTAQARPF